MARRAEIADEIAVHHLRTILLLLAVSATLGISAPSASSGPGPQVIRLIWVQTSNHPDGNERSWTSNLLNATAQFGRPAGVKVGAEVGFSRGPHYVGGIKLPGGVVTYSGKPKHAARNGIVIPIVDGSGIYTGVTGTYTRSKGDKAHPSRTIVVLQLKYA